MRHHSRLGNFVVASAVVVAAWGCTPPPAMGPGVRFAFRAQDRLLAPTNEEIALAPESTAVIDVFEPRELAGGSEVVRADEVDFVTITSATSADDAIVRVTRTDGSRIEVRAGHPGTAVVRIVTARWTHELPFIVAEPARVEMAYTSPDLTRTQPPIALLAGGTARLRMRRVDGMGRVLGGTTLTLPVFVEPPNAGTVSIRPGDREIVDVMFARPGHGVLRFPGGGSLALDVVDPSELSTFDVAAVDASQQTRPLEAVRVGARQLVVVRAMRSDATRVFGLVGLTMITSSTPEVCGVEDASRWYADGVYLVQGKTAGTCALTASLGSRSVDLTVAIAPGP